MKYEGTCYRCGRATANTNILLKKIDTSHWKINRDNEGRVTKTWENEVSLACGDCRKWNPKPIDEVKRT